MNKRFFGLDLHKKYATVCAPSQQGAAVLRKEHVPLGQLPIWAARTLQLGDAVALEATANTWWAYDCLSACAGQVVAVNPIKTRLIAEARIHTDELSAEALAGLRHFLYRLRANKGTNVAIIATARNMPVIIWHLLSRNNIYRGRQVQMIARKLLEWSSMVQRISLLTEMN